MCSRTCWAVTDVLVDNALKRVDGFDLGGSWGRMVEECCINGMQGMEKFVFKGGYRR